MLGEAILENSGGIVKEWTAAGERAEVSRK